jgi:SAM-dependent methyltransferase
LKRHAPATARNRTPILEVLRQVLPATGTVLEIASGTGEHAAFFAAALPTLIWQPSDLDPDALASIEAWRAEVSLANLLAPLRLDAQSDAWPVDAVDAVFSANMIHIAPWSAAEGLLRGAGRHLVAGGLLILYGPFHVGGAPTAPSNASFDADLRARNPTWGVRDLEAVVAAAREQRLEFEQRIDMPANNLMLVFRRVP